MNFNNLCLSTRLGLSFGGVLLLVLVMAGVGAYELHLIQTVNGEQDLVIELKSQARAWEHQIEIDQTRAMVLARSGNNTNVLALVADPMKTGMERMAALQRILDKGLTSAADRTMLSTSLEQHKTYTELRNSILARARQADAVGVEAEADARLAPAGAAYMASVDAIAARMSKAIEEQGREIDAIGRSAMIALAVLAALATGAGALLSWLTTRSVVRPLRQAIATSTRISQGDLSRSISVPRKDELGELLRAIDAMQTSLRGIVSQVRDSSESIQLASTEVASGSTDLSRRTDEQASSLQETASSIEQLVGTVRQSAEAAAQASQFARSASEVATRGGAVVAQVVSTMGEINTSSKKIADIIGTIDGIAFQTNILALNAAVEAARAGDQGRGFAVVASEVRSLAQRSAEAAREIKALIGASVHSVEAGARLVHDAGSTMSEIVTSVQRVNDIIGEISAAASKQSAGIGQVNAAVGQLDHMTQQNAALVEESAASAVSLKDQALRLGEAVSRFQLGAATGTPPPHRASAPAALAKTVVAKASQASRPSRAVEVARKPVPAKAVALASDHTGADWESF